MRLRAGQGGPKSLPCGCQSLGARLVYLGDAVLAPLMLETVVPRSQTSQTAAELGGTLAGAVLRVDGILGIENGICVWVGGY